MGDFNSILQKSLLIDDEKDNKEWEEIINGQTFTPSGLIYRLSENESLKYFFKIRFYSCVIFPPDAKKSFGMNLIDLEEVNLYANQVTFLRRVEENDDTNFSFLINLICEALPCFYGIHFGYKNHITLLHHILVNGYLEKSYPEISIRPQEVRSKILIFIQKHIDRMLNFVDYEGKEEFYDVYFMLSRIICDNRNYTSENKKWAHSVIQERILRHDDYSSFYLRSYLSTMILANMEYKESKSIFSNFDSYIEFIITNSNKMKNYRYSTFYHEQIEVIKFISKQDLKLKVLKFFVWNNDDWPRNKNLFILGGDPWSNEHFFRMEEEIKRIAQNDSQLLKDVEILFINHKNKSKAESV